MLNGLGDALETYLERGWIPVPIMARGKKPSAGDGWPELAVAHAQARSLDGFADDSNVGLLLGEPVDVDLDAPETLSIADLFLPPTLTFGRVGKARSHRLYSSPDCPTVKYAEPKGGMLVELRSSGHQTVVPPSIHESGELIVYDESSPGSVTRVDAKALQRAVALLAGATLLGRAWPEAGRHEAQLALAGGLLRSGVPDDEAELVLRAVCRIAKDEDAHKRQQSVRTTRRMIDAGENVIGWQTLGQSVGRPLIVVLARRWLCPNELTITIGTDIAREVSMAEKALAGVGGYFRRARRIVRVVQEQDPPRGLLREPTAMSIEAVPHDALRGVLSGAARWVRIKDGSEVGARPPPDTVRTLEQAGHWPRLPALEQVVEAPVLLPAGVLVSPGYDEETGLLYKPSAMYPALEAVESAVERLLDVLGDFPFATPEALTGAILAILTPLARYAFRGPAPLFLFTAPSAGSGKSLLARTLGLIATGHEPATGQNCDDEEMRKRLLAIAISGKRLVLFDNVVGELGGQALCGALTSGVWDGRVLGESREFGGPVLTTFYATANNARIGPDMHRRIVHVRLDSECEAPERRSGFRYVLPDAAREAYPQLCVAALSILSGYVEAGRPKVSVSSWGSYEGWALLCLSACVWAGFKDCGPERDRFRESADAEVDEVGGLIRGWTTLQVSAGGPLDARAALNKIYPKTIGTRSGPFPELAEALAALLNLKPLEVPSARRLGMLLAKYEKRIVGGLRLRSERAPSGATKLWFTEEK